MFIKLLKYFMPSWLGTGFTVSAWRGLVLCNNSYVKAGVSIMLQCLLLRGHPAHQAKVFIFS
jgi:hypothetical protein